jgi:hypothetical protein
MSIYISKNWKNRDSEHPNRRTLTDVIAGTSQTVDVVRSEGTVTEAGDAFDASTMNDLEGRIGSAFLLVDGAKLNKPSNSPSNNQVVKYVNGSIVWANEAGGGGGTVYQDYTNIVVDPDNWEALPEPSPVEGASYKNEITLEGLVEGQSIVTIVPEPEMIANGNFYPLVGIEDDTLILYATDLIEDSFFIPLVSVRTINEVTP